jgi:hypothetical protein
VAVRRVSAPGVGEAHAVWRRAVDVDPHSTVAFRWLFDGARALAGQGEAKG